MTKFREYFDLMLKKHAVLFNQFTQIHNQYVLEPTKHQAEFNSVGEQVQSVITEFENRLCHHSEKGQYAKYSHHISDKFWELVRTQYPKIDDVGVEISYSNPHPFSSRRRPTPPKPKTILNSSADEIIQDVLDATLSHMKKIKLT